MGRFGLIGRALGHSFSPAIHALIGDYEYKLYLPILAFYARATATASTSPFPTRSTR